MAEGNEIWQSLLEDISSTQPNTQTLNQPTQQLNPIVQPPQIPQQPTIIQGVDVSHVQPELQQFYVQKVLGQPLTGETASVNLTELNSDVPEEYEDEEEIEIEDGVDTEFNATFQLALPEQPKPVVNNDPFAGLFQTIQPQPTQPIQQGFQLPTQEKRGRGRPRKVANDLLNNLPASLQDTDKSTNINPAISATPLERKEIAINITTKSAREIGESFIRIGQSIIESCNSTENK